MNNTFKHLNFYYLVFCGSILLLGIYKPTLNWDMVGYAASAKNYEINDPVKLHNFIYTELKQTVTKSDYERLTGLNQRRADIANDPQLFYQQLPFFDIRPVYNLSILLLSKTGVNIFEATYLVSAICVCLGVFLIFIGFRNSIDPLLLYILPVFLCGIGLLSIAQLSTPDGLSFLCLSLFAFLFNQKRTFTALVLLPLCVLVRTDLVIFVFLTLVAILFFQPKLRFTSLMVMIATVILYYGVNHFYDSYPWSTLVYVSFLHRTSAPADVNVVITAADYLNMAYNSLWKALREYPLIINMGIFLLNAWLTENDKKSIFMNWTFWLFVMIPMLYVVIHVLLFPAVWKRFFIGFYAMNLIYFFMMLSNKPAVK